MTTLHLGVVDIAYGNKAGESTGDVAGYLENKYHILEVFSEAEHQTLAKAIENSLAGAIENLMLGVPTVQSPFDQAAENITTAMKNFLSSQEVERMGIPGVPTQAALLGINHRFKNARGTYKSKKGKRTFTRNPRRPSFIDTGLYQTSLKAWFT